MIPLLTLGLLSLEVPLVAQRLLSECPDVEPRAAVVEPVYRFEWVHTISGPCCGETFDHGNLGVVVTPMEYGNARIARIEQGSGGTIEVNISDASGTNVDEDFQIIVFND